MTGSAPRIWLATMGIAATLGSEPLVAWQWYQRVQARGSVTVLTAAIFDHPDFLPADCRNDMVFLDTHASSRAEWAGHFARHLWRWWRCVRAHLKAHAGPHDMLLIVSPAAIWFLPWLGGLPVRRARTFYGPLGVDWVTRPLRGSRWPGWRNLRTAAALLLWRLLAPWLPARLALRAPFPGFERLVGGRFDCLGAVPEIEPPVLAMTATGAAPATVAVLHDPRPRKRFAASLAFAIERAVATGLPLAVIGVPDAEQPAIAARAASTGVAVDFLPRFDRSGFRGWLAANAPDFVALSLSEGIPSALIEALLAGCRIHVHAVGGIHWLIACAVDRVDSTFAGAPVVGFTWNAAALAAFEARARAGFEQLLDRLLGPPSRAAAS